MRPIRMLVVSLTLATLLLSPSHAQDIGPVGGAGGGNYRIACEPGDAVVGFDLQGTNVVTRIAPVCGDRKRGGTYGRPWIGSEVEGAIIQKVRCDPGSIANRTYVGWDGTPIVSDVTFWCLNPATQKVNTKGINFRKRNNWTQGGARELKCPAGRAVIGIFGRAGTAIDALGFTCGRV